MRAFRLTQVDTLPHMAEIARRAPQAGEVEIEVAACGLNFADLLTIKGQYQERPPLPMTIGMEVSGRIKALGSDVAGLAVGQRVAAFVGHGGLAEFVTCPASRCVPVPDAMSMIDAAGFLVAYGTSHLALDHRAGLKPGETLLVLGAAGGVGLTAVEIGARMGARVIAVARGVEKCAVAQGAGAHHVIDSATTDLRADLKARGGVDVVYDAIGEPLATPALRSLRPEGRFLSIGFAGGQVPSFPANILLVKNLTVIGMYWGGYLTFREQVLTDSLRQVLDWAECGYLRPHISHILPFDQIVKGLDMLRDRKSTGKVVIAINP